MANLFEGLPESWLQAENPEDVTDDVVNWLRSRQPSPAVKELADTTIDTLGYGGGLVAKMLGAKQRGGLFVDADGNKYDLKTGELLEAAKNTLADTMAENRQFPYGRPEARQNFQRPQPTSERIGDALAQTIGRPKYDPMQFGKELIDQGRVFADEIGTGQNQQ